MQLFQNLLDFIFPRQCLGCGRAHTLFCHECLAGIPSLSIQRCPACEQIATPLGALCPCCRALPSTAQCWFLDGLWILSPYSPSSLLARLIKSLKYKGMSETTMALSALLAERFPFSVFLEQLGVAKKEVAVCPIPLHRRRERERGYNQSLFLADVFAKNHRILLKTPLVRDRFTPPQAQQPSREARLFNLRGAFSISSPTASLLNKKFILIDDVSSTGATLNEAAKVLKAAGVQTVWGVVLARG